MKAMNNPKPQLKQINQQKVVNNIINTYNIARSNSNTCGTFPL